MPHLGQIAALGTAISWSCCALFYTAASHRIGSFSMSHYRMIFGTLILVAAQLITKGTLFSGHITSTNLWLLGVSGFLGFFVTDALLFQSYVDISPRLGILIFNSYPFASALMAWLVLGETLRPLAWIGIAITITGTVWVILEKNPSHLSQHKKHLRRGILLACGAVMFQAVSFAFAKPAMIGADAIDPLTATLIRAFIGVLAFWTTSLIRGRIVLVIKKAADIKAVVLTCTGSIFGVAIGVWLSMVAIKLAPIGIAATLMALMPVTILPMTAVVYGERISWRALIGALIACLGVAVLFNA